MKRRPIDTVTGRLKGYAVSELYLSIAAQFGDGPDVWGLVRYADLARRMGLPWVFNGSNNDTIVALRDALTRMEQPGYVKVKPYTHDLVQVRLLVRPEDLRRRHGDDYVWRCFGYVEMPLFGMAG